MLNCESLAYFRVILRHNILWLVYRWFPEGKVIFVAPSKPLVSQQIDACHKTMRYTRRDAAELTGEITNLIVLDLYVPRSLLVVGWISPEVILCDSGKKKGYST